jgi:hypothetical protein
MPTQTTDNVDLKVEVVPNPLGSAHGAHKMWFNNNNNWTAVIGSATVSVRSPGTAELDLIDGGNKTRTRNVRVGYVAGWRASNTIFTTLAKVPGATSSGEYVDVTSTVSRAQSTPNQPPPRLSPLNLSALVSL